MDTCARTQSPEISESDDSDAQIISELEKSLEKNGREGEFHDHDTHKHSDGKKLASKTTRR